MRPFRAVLVLTVSLLLAACETVDSGLERLDNAFLKRDPQRLLDQGAVRLDTSAARSHLSGNTEFWEAGPVYYDPDGSLETVWLKVKSGGSWTIDASGEVCLTTRTWRKCHHYLAYDGEIVTVVDGKTRGVQKVEAGKKLRR